MVGCLFFNGSFFWLPHLVVFLGTGGWGRWGRCGGCGRFPGRIPGRIPVHVRIFDHTSYRLSLWYWGGVVLVGLV